MPRVYKPKLFAGESAKSSKGQLSSLDLAALMDDINQQPDWRTLARKAMAYYDDDQLSPEVKQVLTDRGQPITTHNLIIV